MKNEDKVMKVFLSQPNHDMLLKIKRIW